MMKRAVIAVVAVMMVAGAAMANGDHGGPGGPGGDHGPAFGGPGGGAIIGSDGTIYITREAASSTSTSRVFEVVAIRSTGTTAFTATLPSGAGHVDLSGTNLLAVTDTTASGATSPTSLITAISTTTGATGWTLAIDGRVGGLEPFSGGTYVQIHKPAATTGGTATRTLEAVSNAGAVLWTVTL